MMVNKTMQNIDVSITIPTVDNIIDQGMLPY
jgi:hypothetical protein